MDGLDYFVIFFFFGVMAFIPLAYLRLGIRFRRIIDSWINQTNRVEFLDGKRKK